VQESTRHDVDDDEEEEGEVEGRGAYIEAMVQKSWKMISCGNSAELDWWTPFL
jgi:hypothetical protein